MLTHGRFEYLITLERQYSYVKFSGDSSVTPLDSNPSSIRLILLGEKSPLDNNTALVLSGDVNQGDTFMGVSPTA